MSARTAAVPLAPSLAACAGPAAVAPPSVYDEGPPPQAVLIETPHSAPPTNDIPESKRREWLEAQRPKVFYAPPQIVERVVVSEPVRYVPTYDCWDDGWASRFSWSLGWWGGGRRRHGWGWGFGLSDGCWW